MAKYIDAHFAQLIADAELGSSDKETVYWVLAHTPTADVQEVKHGRWINESSNMYGPISGQCSVCELFSGTWLRNAPYKYCPHCGALMDGKE